MEALLTYLRDEEVPVSQTGIGHVTKNMVLKASQNLEKIQSDNKIKKHFATILAFNVKILPEAAILAQEKGVTIFAEEVIYHLTDKYNKHVE